MGFTSTLKVEWLPELEKFRVLETFEFHSGVPDAGLFVRCERGMLTDLASIPWFVRWLIPRLGKDAQGAVVHDKAYHDGGMLIRTHNVEKWVPVSRGMCDSLYYQAMIALKVGTFRREAIYRGLQVGGWVAWRRLRAKRVGMTTETTR